MRRAMMRPMTSVPPPAAHGTTSVSGRVGQSWAAAGVTQRGPKQIAVAAASMRIKDMVPHRCFAWRPVGALLGVAKGRGGSDQPAAVPTACGRGARCWDFFIL